MFPGCRALRVSRLRSAPPRAENLSVQRGSAHGEATAIRNRAGLVAGSQFALPRSRNSTASGNPRSLTLRPRLHFHFHLHPLLHLHLHLHPLLLLHLHSLRCAPPPPVVERAIDVTAAFFERHLAG